MTSKKYLTLREAYASIYEKKEKPEMEDDSKHEEEEGEKKSKHSKKEKEEEESESVEEGFGEKAAEFLDKGTKKIQSGLEKMGVPINRAKRQMGTSPRGAKIMRDAGVGPSEKPTGLNNSADLFDIVKGHLMSEGYADTEEAALAIMANMSEEWRQSIVEGIFDFLPKSTTVVPGKYGKNTVLAKKGGVEGVVDKSTGSFTPQKGGWDSMDANRYADERIKQGHSTGGVNVANRRVTPNRVK